MWTSIVGASFVGDEELLSTVYDAFQKPVSTKAFMKSIERLVLGL
jgi:hypothetical protein|tara:strand:- start:276 stop:410 length:135 start_codon:yes stop_codon:yes gene_type:complete